jgi:predicted cupin superfamily sugar epimerase
MSIVSVLIQQYGLEPHPEGGWYKQTYKSNEQIAADALPKDSEQTELFQLPFIFYWRKETFLLFIASKVTSAGIFMRENMLLIYIIQQDGDLKVVSLGNELEKGQSFQHVVPANCWFAGRPAPGSEYCFVGCTVSPGFEFKDLELANATELSVVYPQHKSIIKELCR